MREAKVAQGAQGGGLVALSDIELFGGGVVRIVDEDNGRVIDTDEIDVDAIRQRTVRAEIGRQIEVLQDLMPDLYVDRSAHVEAATALSHLRAAYNALSEE
jgi:hypothetical protein